MCSNHDLNPSRDWDLPITGANYRTVIYFPTSPSQGGSVAEWLACWTHAQEGLGSNRSCDAVGNSFRQTVHTHRASVHKAAKLVAPLLRVAGVTAGLAESNGSLTPGLWLTLPAGWLPRTGINSGTLRSVIEYGLPFTFTTHPAGVSALPGKLSLQRLVNG